MELDRLSSVDLFIESSIHRGEIKAEEVYNLVSKYKKLDFSEILPKLSTDQMNKLLTLE